MQSVKIASLGSQPSTHSSGLYIQLRRVSTLNTGRSLWLLPRKTPPAEFYFLEASGVCWAKAVGANEQMKSERPLGICYANACRPTDRSGGLQSFAGANDCDSPGRRNFVRLLGLFLRKTLPAEFEVLRASGVCCAKAFGELERTQFERPLGICYANACRPTETSGGLQSFAGANDCDAPDQGNFARLLGLFLRKTLPAEFEVLGASGVCCAKAGSVAERRKLERPLGICCANACRSTATSGGLQSFAAANDFGAPARIRTSDLPLRSALLPLILLRNTGASAR